MSYPNINFRNVDNVKYGEGTPVESWIKTGEIYKSRYLEAHVSDYLRMVR